MILLRVFAGIDESNYGRTTIHSREVKLKSVEGKPMIAEIRIDGGRVRVASRLETAKPNCN